MITQKDRSLNDACDIHKVWSHFQVRNTNKIWFCNKVWVSHKNPSCTKVWIDLATKCETFIYINVATKCQIFLWFHYKMWARYLGRSGTKLGIVLKFNLATMLRTLKDSAHYKVEHIRIHLTTKNGRFFKSISLQSMDWSYYKVRDIHNDRLCHKMWDTPMYQSRYEVVMVDSLAKDNLTAIRPHDYVWFKTFATEI